MKRNKILALLGAAVLTVGTVGIAFANTLSVDKPNQAGSTIDDLINVEGVDEDCSDFIGDLAVGEGQVGIHFILTSPESQTGSISGTVDSVAFGPVDGIFHGEGNGAMHFYVVVDGDGDSVVDDATTTVNGGNLTISHICFGAPAPTPTFSATEEGETDAPTDEPDSTPTFSSTEEGDTDAPTEPTTDTIGGNGTSGPADGAWLLVVALGVLLASVVVMTPARAKSQR
jgi:hypothetical protein